MKWFKNFIKRLEQSNKENFGSERMDCCSVNQKSNGNYHKGKKEE